MATNFDKALYQAPAGLESLQEAEPIEIEIDNPDAVSISAGGVEIELIPDTDNRGVDFDANLAEHMDSGELEKIGSEIIEMVDADIASRKEWAEMYVKGLEVLGMRYEERTEPWN